MLETREKGNCPLLPTPINNRDTMAVADFYIFINKLTPTQHAERDSMSMFNDERVYMKLTESKPIYFRSCVADNQLGRTKKYIEVSGRPGPAEFLSPTYSSHLDRYNLTFKIESIPPLQEIKLLYRKLMVSGIMLSGSYHKQRQ